MGPVGIPNRQYSLFNTLRPPDHKGSWVGRRIEYAARKPPPHVGRKKKEESQKSVMLFFYSRLTVWETSVWKREMRWPSGSGLGGACGCFGVPLREHWKGFGAILLPLGRLWRLGSDVGRTLGVFWEAWKGFEDALGGFEGI